MQSFYGLRENPLCIPNFPLREERAPERNAALRRELLGEKGRILLICPSAVSPGRLHMELIRAMSLLPEEYRLVTFRGSGPYARQCESLVETSGLEERVKLFDPCPYDQLAAFLSCADVAVILNDWKGSSGYWMANSGRLANCLSASVPVVTSDVPNLESLVYKWNLGECCDAYVPSSIADAVRRLVDGPPGIEKHRSAVRQAFQNELHFEHRGVLLTEELCRLLHEKGRSGAIAPVK
jgi:glycosyltransferase involved in cell wall biosynthesis